MAAAPNSIPVIPPASSLGTSAPPTMEIRLTMAPNNRPMSALSAPISFANEKGPTRLMIITTSQLSEGLNARPARHPRQDNGSTLVSSRLEREQPRVNSDVHAG